MVSTKSILIALVAATAQIVSATPPACLLAAVNTMDKPADVQGICKDHVSDIQSSIQSLCSGSNVQSALDAFADTCNDAGIKIAAVTNSTSTSSSVSGMITSTLRGSASNNTMSASAMPTTMIYTSTYSDADCSCTKTSVISSTGMVMVTPTGSAGSSGNGAAASALPGDGAGVKLGMGGLTVGMVALGAMILGL